MNQIMTLKKKMNGKKQQMKSIGLKVEDGKNLFHGQEKKKRHIQARKRKTLKQSKKWLFKLEGLRCKRAVENELLST